VAVHWHFEVHYDKHIHQNGRPATEKAEIGEAATLSDEKSVNAYLQRYGDGFGILAEGREIFIHIPRTRHAMMS
jgi:hypothetical protein